ncbi:MAG TPA: hypothetical protein VE954_36690 [Oligoflexus sp.]|uniref:hypothetical protein n=1 Tax=Oligoflexus sp. TaxID=1971216 RepID=UPI002D2BECA2|nr:hypothetical protein [Oligoflexus sp.]HYX38675.1 hypothetical protein [Oligoflexus sp.]
MKTNDLVKMILCVLPILACASTANAQTNLADLKVKKSLWRAIVEKKIDDVQGWNAGFPTERAVDKENPITFGTGGDTLMYAAMLCASGERAACSVIPNSLESSGQLRRNPLLKDQPNASKYGMLSKDHAMATLFWLSLPDHIVPLETKRKFALSWQKSFDQQVTEAKQCDVENTKFCLTSVDPIDQMIEDSDYDLSNYLPGQKLSLNANIKLPTLSTENLKKAVSNVPRAGQEALARINEKAKNSKWYGQLETTVNALTRDAQTVQGCLSSTRGVETCIKESLKDSQAYVKAVIAATALCTEGAIRTIDQPLNEQEIGRCVVSMGAAVLALPRVCDDVNCVMSPTQMAYTNKIWERLGLNPPFVSPILDGLGIDSEDMALSTNSFTNMNKSHLAALNILVRRNLGMKTSRLAGRLTNKQPNNPLFLAISNNPAFTKEAIAGLLITQCLSIESIKKEKIQYLTKLGAFDHESFWRWKTNEQDEFTPDANNNSEKISMVWDCIYVANLLGVTEYPYLSAIPNVGFTIKAKKNDNPTVYNTVARGVSGGVPPLRYELLTKPNEFTYFTFEAESGNFIFRPTNSYFGGSFKFAVTDAIGRRVESSATIAFDHSEIYPGHPPLSRIPETPLPANINPLFKITHLESGQLRTMTDITTEPAEALSVSSGNLQIEAEAYIDSVDENYTGVLDCTLDWTSKGGTPSLIKDNDEYPKNFFVQQTIQAQSLEPYELSLVRMTCMAPDMPIIVRDIPVLFTPEAAPLKKPLDQAEYSYANNSGAKLKLVLNKNASNDLDRVYNYTLNSTECGQQIGTLVAASNANKLTINGSFDGFLIAGDPQKLVWLDVPVCDKTSAMVWKLLTSSSGNNTNSGTISNACNLKAYPTKDGMTLAKPSSFDTDMNQCGKPIRAADWSCSWVAADKTWIIPGLKSVVFTADRWGTSKYNIFSFETVKKNGCADPEALLQPQTNSCAKILQSYKATDSTGNIKPLNFASDMAECASKVKSSDWSCSWVSADETWVIPALKTVIFTAKSWGANKYNVFGFDTIRKQGCKNPDSFVRK